MLPLLSVVVGVLPVVAIAIGVVQLLVLVFVDCCVDR